MAPHSIGVTHLESGTDADADTCADDDDDDELMVAAAAAAARGCGTCVDACGCVGASLSSASIIESRSSSLPIEPRAAALEFNEATVDVTPTAGAAAGAGRAAGAAECAYDDDEEAAATTFINFSLVFAVTALELSSTSSMPSRSASMSRLISGVQGTVILQ